MHTPPFQTIEFERSARGFATLWLNRPEKNNAFNAEMIRELILAIDAVAADKTLRFLLLRVDRLDQEDVDVGELQLTHYRLTKRAEHQLRLSEEQGDYGLEPATGLGSGKPHDPEKKRLSEIIEALNDIFGAEVSDDDQLQFLTGIANRISRQEDVMAQVNSHSVEQVMHGLFPKRVLDTVLDAMTDNEKMSLEVLDNETKSRAFALVILKMLKTAASFDGGREAILCEY